MMSKGSWGIGGSLEAAFELTVHTWLNCKYLAYVFSFCPLYTGKQGSPTTLKDSEHEAALNACWVSVPAGKHI